MIKTLKAMWQPTIRRGTDLIIAIDTAHGKRTIATGHWPYDVQFAFLEALDIRFETRVKNGKPFPVWTQGPCISFKEGDTLRRRDGTAMVQVRLAQPMGWNAAADAMYEGIVSYDHFEREDGAFVLKERIGGTQMEFLATLAGEADRPVSLGTGTPVAAVACDLPETIVPVTTGGDHSTARPAPAMQQASLF
jgi:hypothetical protein